MSSIAKTDRRLDVCILDSRMKVTQTDAGPRNLKETFQFAADIGLKDVGVFSGVVEWRNENGEREDCPCWMIQAWQED